MVKRRTEGDIRLRMGRRDIASVPLWRQKLISWLADTAARLLLCALPGSAVVRRWIYVAIMTQSIKVPFLSSPVLYNHLSKCGLHPKPVLTRHHLQPLLLPSSVFIRIFPSCIHQVLFSSALVFPGLDPSPDTSTAASSHCWHNQ